MNLHLKWNSRQKAMDMPENANKVNLKSASIAVIMLLHEGLTHIQSQIKPRLLFGESFTLKHQLNVAPTSENSSVKFISVP